MRSRRPGTPRPARPAPVCEDCGADVWWAWGLHGKVWTPLEPVRYQLNGGVGTYEVWRDAHGGLLCKYRAPGERGDMDQSWRGNHHNATCGTWRYEVARALIREARTAVAVMDQQELHVLDRALIELHQNITERAALLDQTDGAD